MTNYNTGITIKLMKGVSYARKKVKKLNQTEILVKEVEKRVLTQVELIINESESLEEVKEKIKSLKQG